MTHTDDDDDIRTLFRAHEHLATPVRAQRALVAATARRARAPRPRMRERFFPGLVVVAVLAVLVAIAVVRPSADRQVTPVPATSASPLATPKAAPSPSTDPEGRQIGVARGAPAGTDNELVRTLERFRSMLGPEVVAVLAQAPATLEKPWGTTNTGDSGDIQQLMSCGFLDWAGTQEPPSPSPSIQPVAGPDGVTHQVQVLGALATLNRLDNVFAGDCFTSITIRLTSATPARMNVMLGPVVQVRDVPAWRYTIAGSSDTLVAAALPAKALPVLMFPEFYSDSTYAYAHISQVHLGTDQRTLRVDFVDVGRDEPRCVEGYTASWALDQRGLAISVRDVLRPDPASGSCVETNRSRTIDIVLPEDFGTRVVLDSPRAVVVPVIRAP